jgi:hypothetical protein
MDPLPFYWLRQAPSDWSPELKRQLAPAYLATTVLTGYLHRSAIATAWWDSRAFSAKK